MSNKKTSNKNVNKKTTRAREKNKKSVGYEILIGILSFILVAVAFGGIGNIIFEDFKSTKTADDLYYYIVTDENYSPYELYENIMINKANGAKETPELLEIYAYADYYMHSFDYYAETDTAKKEKYKAAMEQDKERMGSLVGLSKRIDRYFSAY